MMLNNPFVNRGKPIRQPEQFYGRANEVKEIFRYLHGGQSISIIGPRRIGKTSLALFILALDVFQEYGFLSNEVCFVYFDCSEWRREEAGVLYSLLLEGILGSLTDLQADLSTKC